MSCDSDTTVNPASNTASCALSDTMDFGVTTIGESVEKTIEILNSGGGILDGEIAVSTSGPCDGFSIISGHGKYSLSAGQTHRVTVRFEPVTTGTKTCRLETGSTLCGAVELTAIAQIPTDCSVEPSFIDFGLVTLGAQRDTTFTITNTGGGILSGRVWEPCGDFSITAGSGPFELAANESLQVSVRFAPKGGGTYSCTVSASNELCSPVTLSAVTEIPRVAGTVVGDSGVILRTTDGGATWSRQDSGTNALLTAVAFSDKDTGTVVGKYGTILRTVDGGETWVRQTSGTSAFLGGVSFADANNGIVVGQRQTILRTTDGGNTWNAQESGTTSELIAAALMTPDIGTIVGWDGVILRTTDGGSNWNLQDSGTAQFFDAVHFLDEDFGIAIASGNPETQSLDLIARTQNGGEDWTLTEIVSRGLNDVAFADYETGVAVGVEGEIFRTGNGGETWERRTSAASWLNGVDLVAGNVGVAVGTEGQIIITTDGGNTWAVRPSGISALLYDVSLVRY